MTHVQFAITLTSYAIDIYGDIELTIYVPVRLVKWIVRSDFDYEVEYPDYPFTFDRIQRFDLGSIIHGSGFVTSSYRDDVLYHWIEFTHQRLMSLFGMMAEVIGDDDDCRDVLITVIDQYITLQKSAIKNVNELELLKELF